MEPTVEPTDPVKGLLDLAGLLSSGEPIAVRLAEMCRIVTLLLGCDRSSIFVQRGARFRSLVNHGGPQDLTEMFRDTSFSSSHPLFGAALAEDRVVVVDDLDNSDLLRKIVVDRAQIKSIVVAPITNPHLPSETPSTSAFITAEFNERVGSFDTTQAEYLLGIARTAGLAISEDHLRQRSEEVNRELERIASFDDLTGLPNRRSIRMHLQERLGTDAAVSVLVLDLDDFKTINDSLGHEIGDQVLKLVSRRLSDIAHPHVVGRFGGDEFLVLWTGDRQNGSDERLANRILDGMGRSLPGAVGGGIVGASIGIARRQNGSDASALVRDADTAMYLAKHRERAAVRVFDDRARTAAVRRQALRARLPHALDSGELALFFQPVWAVDGEALSGFEALLRWPQPDGEVWSAGEFLDLVEGTPFMRRLNGWVIATATLALQDLRRLRPDITMSVNVDPANLDEETVGHVASSLEAASIPPENLVIEVVEGALRDTAIAVKAINELNLMGVQLSLDDYGTGYSSLALLADIPISELKIDRSIVHLGVLPPNHQAIAAVVKLAEWKRARVVAEGIEDRALLPALRDLGCTHVQGFALGRPAPLSAALDLLAATLTQSSAASTPVSS